MKEWYLNFSLNPIKISPLARKIKSVHYWTRWHQSFAGRFRLSKTAESESKHVQTITASNTSHIFILPIQLQYKSSTNIKHKNVQIEYSNFKMPFHLPSPNFTGETTFGFGFSDGIGIWLNASASASAVAAILSFKIRTISGSNHR